MEGTMNTHHTKAKGDLGVLKAQLDLFEKGFWVSIPLTENAPFDLIATKDGRSYSVQVKFRSLSSRGHIDISFRTNWSDSNGCHHKPIDRDQIDWYIIYCPDTDKCYYLNLDDYNQQKSVTLRITYPKNNQLKNVIFADDYLSPPLPI
jgi:hypothetical protein